MTVTASLDELVREIEDPELPHVTIGDLGIVRSVTVEAGTATVLLTPTYTGCPATEQIRDDVAEAVRTAGYEPDVRLVMSPAWSTDWITERGHQRLLAAGIAPPPPAGETQRHRCRRAGRLSALRVAPHPTDLPFWRHRLQGDLRVQRMFRTIRVVQGPLMSQPSDGFRSLRVAHGRTRHRRQRDRVVRQHARLRPRAAPHPAPPLR